MGLYNSSYNWFLPGTGSWDHRGPPGTTHRSLAGTTRRGDRFEISPTLPFDIDASALQEARRHGVLARDPKKVKKNTMRNENAKQQLDNTHVGHSLRKENIYGFLLLYGLQYVL